MKSKNVFRIEERLDGIFVVDSKEDGLNYFFLKGDERIGISGICGITFLTVEQMRSLCLEIRDIADELEVRAWKVRAKKAADARKRRKEEKEKKGDF